MSTKIFNGIQILGAATLDAAFRLLNKPYHRKLFEDQARKQLFSYVAHTAERKFDRPFIDESVEPITLDKALWVARDELRERQKEGRADNNPDSLIDIQAEISLIPTGKRVLGLYYVGNSGMRDLILSLPCVVEYGYWNNTDRPDELTAAQWRAREQAWERAMPEVSAPAEVGVSLQLHPPEWRVYPMAGLDAFRPYFRSLSERAQGYARDTIHAMRMKQIEAERSNVTQNKPDGTRFMEFFYEANSYMKTPDGREAVVRLAAQYETKLVDLQTYAEAA